MYLRAFIITFGILVSGPEQCLCNQPCSASHVKHYHQTNPYHQTLLPTQGTLRANDPVHLTPINMFVKIDDTHRDLSGGVQPSTTTCHPGNDFRQSRIFTKLFSLPGAVADALISGEITI
ncbi:unnamed protein product, partial [Iphiclides podalirius]